VPRPVSDTLDAPSKLGSSQAITKEAGRLIATSSDLDGSPL